jgi:hypothetical protein
VPRHEIEPCKRTGHLDLQVNSARPHEAGKMAAAAEEITVKDMILKLVESHLAELEKK